MRSRTGWLVALIVLSTPAQAEVQVQFVAPETFTDVVADGSGRSRAEVLAEIETHVRRLSTKLGARQDLAIDVLDLDLAGEPDIGRGSSNGLRIVTAATPPRVRLRWRLSQGRRVVSSGEETLSDAAWGLVPQVSRDALAAEKALLTVWFGGRIATTGPRIHPDGSY